LPAAGIIADALGFEALFAAAALSGMTGLAPFVARVRDPRHGHAAG
jgi:hypothetical protein